MEVNPGPAPKKLKKTKPSAAQAVDNVGDGSTRPATTKDKGKGKQADVPEPIPTTQVAPSAVQPVIPKSKAKAKAKKNDRDPNDISPAAPTDQPSKKPKSKAVSSLAPATEPQLQPPATSEQQDAAQATSSAPAKTKKGKKASAIHNPPDNAGQPAQGQPSNEEELALADPSIVSATQGVDVSQSLPKKRGRKSVVEAPDAATSTGDDGMAAPNDAVEQPPPAKKRRKSKEERAEDYGPVAVTLPGPAPSRRKSIIAASTNKPVIAPRKSLDAYTDIMQRWVSDASASRSQGSVGSGSGAGGSESVAPAVAPIPVDGPGATTEDHTDGKKKSKKKKKTAAPATAVTSDIPASATPAGPTLCLVCQTVPPTPHKPLECPMLSRSGADVIDVVEERVADLAATQGPARVHQMVISRLRDWIKQRKKEEEVRGRSD